MRKKPVELIRIPINTNCEDCDVKINFGQFAYFIEESDATLCIECGTKRGWSSKQRVKQAIKEIELKEQIKALKEQKKIEISSLMYLKKTVNLYKLGENDIQLEKQIVAVLRATREYMEKIATPEEKEAFEKLKFEIRKTQEMQKQIREEIHSRMFLLQKEKAKRKHKLLFPDENRDAEEIEEETKETEQAEEVPAQ